MWLKYVNIVVTPANDPSKRQVFSKHRIDFEVRSTIGWPADTANITLFNLSLEEIKFLQNKNYGDMYIDIQAGYQDEMQGGTILNRTNSDSKTGAKIDITDGATPATLFSGMITNVVGFKRPPEVLTNLFCISKAYGKATNFTQMKAIPPKTTLEDAIRSMANDYGFTTVSTFGVDADDLRVVLPLGRTFHDTFLIEFRNLLGEYNLNFQITTGEIQIFPETYGNKDAVDRMSKDREPIKLDANSVIGNPIAGICTFSVNTFLNSNVQPGMILDVSKLLGTELLANGVVAVQGPNIILNTSDSAFRYTVEDKYVIMEVVHHGSTHTFTFQSSISSVIGGNNAMGGNELAWQDMYRKSGMAMED
ncbi:MAG: hypothetical protein [Caudoviricetes sp.]|nr:MAG: hypothetical protein [Caudoviricetes sp.]